MNPDHAARADILGKRYGLPPTAALQNLPQIEQKSKADAARAQLEASPRVADYLRRNTFTAAQAHDDLKNLGEIERTVGGTFNDIGVTMAKGVLGLRQGIIGLADLIPFTEGRLGKLDQQYMLGGTSMKTVQERLDKTYSAAQQRAHENVSEADGFVNKVGALLANPSVAVTTIGESVPSMIGGAAIGRGLLAAAPRVSAWLAAAFGEGVMGAGAAAEGFRAEDSQGLLDAKHAAAAVLTGIGTAGFAAGGGWAAKRFGFADMDTVLVKGGMSDAAAKLSKKDFALALGKAGVSEGLFEEMPQSAQEQIWKNWADDKPLSQGVGSAMAEGLVVGMVGGSGFQAMKGLAERYSRDTSDGIAAAMAAGNMDQAMAAAASSALRTRNPEAFGELVNNVTNGSQVWVDASVLAQMPPEMVERMGLTQEVAAAAETNAPVPVNVSDILLHASGTPAAEEFSQNSRADPEAPTALEAKEGAKVALETVTRDLDRLVAESANGEAIRASAEAVRTNIASQLEATGRHSPSVAQAMSQFASAFFATQGARHGMTAEQMYQRYPLRFLAQAGVQAPAATLMDQPGVAEPVDLTPGVRQFVSGNTTVDYTVSNDGKRAEVTMAKTPEAQRGQGSARRAMQAFLDEADAKGMQVVLTADPMDKSTSKAKLAAFYKSLGFVPNKGKAKDFTTRAGMVREAQARAVDETTGLPLNADGTVTVYHHTSAQRAEQIRSTGMLRSAGEPDLYFTTTADTTTGYGDTAVPIRVKPERLQIDDEFPDGRTDYRVGAPAKGRRVRFVESGEGVLEQRRRISWSRYPSCCCA